MNRSGHASSVITPLCTLWHSSSYLQLVKNMHIATEFCMTLMWCSSEHIMPVVPACLRAWQAERQCEHSISCKQRSPVQALDCWRLHMRTDRWKPPRAHWKLPTLHSPQPSEYQTSHISQLCFTSTGRSAKLVVMSPPAQGKPLPLHKSIAASAIAACTAEVCADISAWMSPHPFLNNPLTDVFPSGPHPSP